MANEGIKLYNKVAFDIVTTETPTPREHVVALNLEVATLGYTLGPDLFTALEALGGGFPAVRDPLLLALTEMKGADEQHIKLFSNFPYSTPDQRTYMEKRVLGNIASEMGIRLGGNVLTPLSCGHVIDSALFDLEDFGACPICQYQVPELSQDDVAVYDFKSVTPLTPLGYSADFYAKEASTLLARQSSLSGDEKELIRFAHRQGVARDISITMPTGAIFKETLPFAYKIFGPGAVRDLLSGATDVMRIAYFLSDETADLSLKENVRFKLSSPQKRGIFDMLEGLPRLEEDMMRNRERWLRLGERLNPGVEKTAKRWPNTAKAFHRLRNDPKSIVTFNRQVEASIRSETVDGDFINLMAARPAEFSRKLDFMLRGSKGGHEMVLTAFEERIVGNITDKLLLEMSKYFGSRDLLDRRMFFPKGQANKVQVVEDKRKPLPSNSANRVVEICHAELQRRFAELAPLGKVWIDPILKGVLLPFNRRGDSSTVGLSIPKGSRVPVNGDVVRAFIWWKNPTPQHRVDVDLSMAMMNDKMQQVGHLAFTNLRSAGMVHSGDIQDAPKGASEFIDFDIDIVRKSGVRYLAMSVIVFAGGNTFKDFPCFAGFMERDALRSGATYEPESVRAKFDISPATTSHMPVLFDLETREVIYADMASGQGYGGAIAAQREKSETLTQGMLSLPQRKPTVWDVVHLNATARGEIVEDRDDADHIIGFDDLAELLETGGIPTAKPIEVSAV